MQRIVIIGTTGSGKTTLGEALAPRLGAELVDLDTLHWRPNWQEAPADEFRALVDHALQVERWVVCGNYSKVRDLIWVRADTLIWLDYPFPLVFWRLFRRTVARIVTRENLWGSGNTESWRVQFLSRDSLFLWALKTHWRYQRSIAQAVQQPEFTHLRVVRLRSPRKTARWLKSLDP